MNSLTRAEETRLLNTLWARPQHRPIALSVFGCLVVAGGVA